MDLTVSPDFDALICYGVVFVSGLISAWLRVLSFFPNNKLAWLVPQTWLLFLGYLAVPLLLFWMLDRTGAINDTSFFAAVLVGVSYPKILTGNSSSIKPTGTLSAIWSPFLAWADRIASQVRNQLAANDRYFREKLETLASRDDAILKNYADFARAVTTNAPALDKQFTDADTLLPTLGDKNVRQRKARIAIDEISLTADYARLLHNKSLVDNWTYYAYAIGWWNTIKTSPFLLLIVLVFVGALVAAVQPEIRLDYYIWRLGKSNATKLDQFRTSQHLSAYLADKNRDRQTAEKLTYQLQRPGHSMDQLNMIVQLLVEHRDNLDLQNQLPSLLIESLRADSVDSRSRVQSGLLLLAKERPNATLIPPDLNNWKPADGDTLESLEHYVREWRAYFAAPTGG
jgi:hypothetical protein